MHLNLRPTIDWDQVKSRLRESQAWAEATRSEVETAELANIYRERARLLATRSTAGSAPDGWPALVFTVGGERLSIATRLLVEVLPYDRCSPIAGARPELLGAINVRGHICSVLDLARMLELPADGDRPPGYIVLLRGAAVEVGLRVDGVQQIATIVRGELDCLGGELAAWSSQYLLGRTPSGIGVLNVEAVRSHPVFAAAGA
ncbi:MAG TPA: chemotaxis protein CheW [Pirellulales bacterium]